MSLKKFKPHLCNDKNTKYFPRIARYIYTLHIKLYIPISFFIFLAYVILYLNSHFIVYILIYYNNHVNKISYFLGRQLYLNTFVGHSLKVAL